MLLTASGPLGGFEIGGGGGGGGGGGDDKEDAAEDAATAAGSDPRAAAKRIAPGVTQWEEGGGQFTVFVGGAAVKGNKELKTGNSSMPEAGDGAF